LSQCTKKKRSAPVPHEVDHWFEALKMLPEYARCGMRWDIALIAVATILAIALMTVAL
jgi:hypothetical protein